MGWSPRGARTAAPRLQQGEKVRPGGSWCRVQQGGCHGTDQLIFVFFKTTSHHNRNCFICRCAAILRERRARGFVVAAQISHPRLPAQPPLAMQMLLPPSTGSGQAG